MNPIATSGALPPLMAAIRLGSNVSLSGLGWRTRFRWIQGYCLLNPAIASANGLASSAPNWCQTVSVTGVCEPEVPELEPLDPLDPLPPHARGQRQHQRGGRSEQ